MENIMVVFSSTDIPQDLIDRSIALSKEKGAKLIILDVRDSGMSEKVGELTENVGFMGDKIVQNLKKQISHGRCDVIYQKLTIIEDAAKREGIPYEIVVERGPFAESILRVAKKKNVKTIVCQSRESIGSHSSGFEVLQL
ncbi:MAG TPA: universal stress protein [Euryarchaeota archaeon]|nr:universal stress protein family protein [archaeon BMS3Abin16]GBE56968.1 universal stress protein family protein [archaeon BMS3Bbin16]HDH28614.1 universal stress protein [Euryarchaeota archaeon]HDY74069.1 universal stress protein [Euryarchaeota archaeon]